MKRMQYVLILITTLICYSASAAEEVNAPETPASETLEASTTPAPTAEPEAESRAKAVPPAPSDPAPARVSMPIDADTSSETTTSSPPLTPEEAAPPIDRKKKKKKVRVKARIHTRWEMSHEPSLTGDDELTNEFIIRRARFKLEWAPETWLSAVLQVGGFHKPGSLQSLLRDAYLHFAPFQYLEIRAGLFKKGFSRLALRSSGKLRVLERGEGNEVILDDLRYGGRDIGIQLSGRIVPSLKLDYQLGLYNGTNVTDGDQREFGDEKDVVARLKVRPMKYLGIGVNGSFKFFSEKENEKDSAWAAGADAVMKIIGIRLHLEAILAKDHAATLPGPEPEDEMPLIISGVGILSYRHKFHGKIALAVEPVFMMEVLDPDTNIVDDEVLIYSAGFNSYFGKYLRIMIHGEFRRPFRNSEATFPKRDKLMLQLCFDI